MFNKMMKEAKKHLAMLLAAAVVVSGIPAISADAASVVFKNADGTTNKEVSGNYVKVSDNAVYTSEDGAAWEQAKTPEGKWNFEGNKTVSSDEVIIVKAVSGNTPDEPQEEPCKHTNTETKTTPATCDKDGKIETICKDCKAVIKTEPVKATGHKWDEGKVTKEATALEEGTKTYTCSVCKETKTESIAKLKATIKLNAKSIKLQVKKSTTAVKATGLAKGDSVASWKSSNTKVATVSKSGKITAKKTGTAKITVTTKAGAKATVKVTVQKKAVKTTKVSVNKKKVTLKKGQTFNIVATKSPITAQDKVTYKSSNKKVATVSKSGKITAKKAGKATITVKAGSKKATVKVTVTKATKKK